MKNSTRCPKCQSKEIARIPAKIVHDASNIIVTGLLSHVKVTRYLCLECGFSEEWIEQAADREVLRKQYPPSSG